VNTGNGDRLWRQPTRESIPPRCRAVTKLGPGGVQDWAGDVITILRDAHQAVEAARARGDTALDQQALDGLRERYDTAVASGIIHNRLRDWDGSGNHPGHALGTWLRDYKEQVFLFTRVFAVSWTNNVSERGAKAAKRHQAVSGYWHSLAPSPAGAACAATWTRPPPTAPPHSMPSATPSPENRGYRHSPHSADARACFLDLEPAVAAPGRLTADITGL
jgi:hypothetical protein